VGGAGAGCRGDAQVLSQVVHGLHLILHHNQPGTHASHLKGLLMGVLYLYSLGNSTIMH